MNVIPASEACRESILKGDSGEAGMTEKPLAIEFIRTLIYE